MLWPDIKCSSVEVVFYGLIEHLAIAKSMRLFDSNYYQFVVQGEPELKYEEIDQTLMDQWIENL